MPHELSVQQQVIERGTTVCASGGNAGGPGLTQWQCVRPQDHRGACELEIVDARIPEVPHAA